MTTLHAAEFTFGQDGNSVGSTGIDELLNVSLEDGGAGHFLVLRTEGWSIDSPAELSSLLYDILDVVATFNKEN